MEPHKGRLLEEIQKLVDFNINVIPNQTLAVYYKNWISDLESGNITGPLKRWISNQMDYYREKERDYAKYLESLINN